MADFDFTIPSAIDGTAPVTFALSSGQSAFVLGANGSGKSSLMHFLYTKHQAASVRISAHRQTWFTSDSLELSPQSKRQSEQSIRSMDQQPAARWKDDYASARANIAVYELIDAENVRARKIAGAVDADDMAQARVLSAKDAPIAVINELLQLSGLPIEVAIHENERILAKKLDSEQYSIAELSDGERNALLIAASVLTASPGSLILVDEPERHLHRSIISPLLTHLFAKRGDCTFVVSTHEALLPIDHPDSMTLLIRTCTYQGKRVKGWDIDMVSGRDGIPEDIRADIYGSRRKLLFVEGTEESLDKPLYGILFPDVTVVPKGDCKEVEKAVLGIRGSSDLHWALAYGLVDEDSRAEKDREKLERQGVFPIPCYSVESLYYHPAMLASIAGRIAQLDGSVAEQRKADSITAAITSVIPHRERLCKRVASRKVREYMFEQIPGPEEIDQGDNVQLEIPVATFLQNELSVFDKAIEESDYLKLIQRYPLRETPALTQVAVKMGFRTRKDYEAAVLKACADDGSVQSSVISWLGQVAHVLRDGEQTHAEHVHAP